MQGSRRLGKRRWRGMLKMTAAVAWLIFVSTAASPAERRHQLSDHDYPAASTVPRPGYFHEPESKLQ